MGLGILEPSGGRHVPGTVSILEKDLPAVTVDEAYHPSLKYDRRGKEPILLVPQPTDDPNDPLNWSLMRRDLIFLPLCLVSVISTSLSSLLAADSLLLVYTFGLTISQIALLTGYHLMGVGFAGVWFVPSARIWGKRHLYLFGNLLVVASSVWAGSSTSYASFLWARIFQGIALAPFEALLGATVGDIYFVHERGKRMAAATVALFGSAFFAPVIVGKIVDSIGWQWSFYFVAILAGVCFPLMFFFVPELAYRRPVELNLDWIRGQQQGDLRGHQFAGIETGTLATAETTNNEPKQNGDASGQDQFARNGGLHGHVPRETQKRSYWQTLLPFNGRKTDERFYKLFLRPFPLFLQPGIVIACLFQGVIIGWTVFIGVVLAVLLYAPPLLFGPLQVGYMYSSGFIGTVLGFALIAVVADPLAKYLSHKNGGVYEPEFRLVLVVPQLILCGIGLYGFGWTTADLFKYSWIGPEIFFGFVTAGMVCGAAASSLYIVDAYREIAIESFTCQMMFKNFFSFALTFYAYDWIIARANGVKYMFIVAGSVQVAVCCLALPLYMFGKKNRDFFARHDLLDLFGLR